MKLQILHILLVVFISGVIGDLKESTDDGTKINGHDVTGIPTVNTVSTQLPPEPTSPPPTTLKPSTVPPHTTTDKPITTTDKPTTTSPIPKTTTPSPTTPPTKATTTTTNVPPTNVTSTTESTTAVPTSAPSHKGRRFDGPSFIGGIILACGLIAVGFVSWKFYKTRTERNYHTL